MVYGPYQSKLLRLVLGQYRKGLDRHRRAVRQTRSTVVTGAVLGGTWALVPLQAAVRWSQQWARQLKRITTSERSQRLGSSEVECEATDDSGAISQVLSVLDDTFLASTLSTQKISGLAGGIKALLLHRFAWLRRNRDAQITGFASDLETRSLLLVIDYTSVWGGLSGDQQQKLEREIAKRLAGTAVCAVEGPANGLDLSISSGLAKPVRSMGLASRSSAGWALPSPASTSGLAYSARAFWVEVLRAVANLKRQRRGWLPAGMRWLRPSEGCNRGLFGWTGETSLLKGVAGYRTPRLTSCGGGSNRSLEATVISSHYVQHPLEKLLNWVDKGLLWLEQRWQQLIDWLRRTSKVSS